MNTTTDPVLRQSLQRVSERIAIYVKTVTEQHAGDNALPKGESLLDSSDDIHSFLTTKFTPEELKMVLSVDVALLALESKMKIEIDKTGMDPKYFGDSLAGTAMIKTYLQKLEEGMEYLIALITQVVKFPKPEHRSKLRKAAAHIHGQRPPH